VSSFCRFVLLGLFGISLLPACYPPPALPRRILTLSLMTTISKSGQPGDRVLLDFWNQRNGNNFHAYWAEFEYGATAWWTTELYLDGQTTFHDSTVFTGFRWRIAFGL